MDFTILFYGFVGGISPEIIRIYKICKEDGAFSYSSGLLFLSLLVALLGAIFAYGLGSTTPQQAIWIGASTPVIISNFMKKPPGGK